MTKEELYKEWKKPPKKIRKIVVPNRTVLWLYKTRGREWTKLNHPETYKQLKKLGLIKDENKTHISTKL